MQFTTHSLTVFMSSYYVYNILMAQHVDCYSNNALRTSLSTPLSGTREQWSHHNFLRSDHSKSTPYQLQQRKDQSGRCRQQNNIGIFLLSSIDDQNGMFLSSCLHPYWELNKFFCLDYCRLALLQFRFQTTICYVYLLTICLFSLVSFLIFYYFIYTPTPTFFSFTTI